VLATDRLQVVTAAIGGVSLLLSVAALAVRSPGLAAWAVALCGAEYGVFLGFRTVVDRWAPLLAGALFVAAELGYRATESSDPAPERDVVVRSGVWIVGGGLVAVAIGSVLLAASGGANVGLGFEAFGVAATVAALAVVVGVVARAR
jgi:hypothetical protein